MKKFLIAFEILIYLLLIAGISFDFVSFAKYSNEITNKIAAASIIIVFCVIFVLSTSVSKNYFSFRAPFISFLILTICFSVNNFSNILISGDLFCIVIFSLLLVFFASKGETKLFISSFILFYITTFAFIFYNKDITPTNVFFVSFSAITAFFAFVSSHFNNKMEIFKKESELKLRIANKIQSIDKRRKGDFN